MFNVQLLGGTSALLPFNIRRDVGVIHADIEGVVIVMEDREELVAHIRYIEVDLEGAIRIHVVDDTETE